MSLQALSVDNTRTLWRLWEVLLLSGIGGAIAGMFFSFRRISRRLQQSIAELQAERNFVSAVLETAGALVVVLDQDGRIIRFNRACEQTTGYRFSEVQGIPFWDLFLVPEEIEPVKAVFEALKSGNFPSEFESYWQTKDGQRRLIAWSNTVLRPGDRAPQYIIGSGIDITERKQAEAALRLSEEKFSKAFRASPDSVTITTLNEGRVIEVNDSFLENTGFTREEVIGLTTNELNLWANPEDREQIVQQLRERGSVRNQECEFRVRRTQESITGLFSAEVIDVEGQSCLLSVINNITERKRAEEAIRLSSERERLLGEIALRIRQSLDLEQILNRTVDEVQKFLQADRVLISYLGSNMRGQVIAEAVVPGQQSCLGQAVAEDSILEEIQALFQDQPVHVMEDLQELELEPNSSGRLEFLKTYAVKAAIGVSIMLGRQLYGLLVAHQCTGPRQWQPAEIALLQQLATQVAIAIQQAQLYEQVQTLNASLERQVEERTAQLQQKMQELQEVNRLKDVFLHAVSHDLRTPVMGMLLVLKNLLKSEEPDAQKPALQETVRVSRSILERMVQSSDRQLTLINSLLEVHASEATGIILQPEPVQLGELIVSILKDLEPVIAKNQATCVNLVPATLPLIDADSHQLWRVFDNLVTNALKHNPPGIEVSVRAIAEVDRLRCSVADNGVGMNLSAEEAANLFNPYYRGHESRHLTGIGLGLYLCRQIIKAHGGEIGVESQRGQGTKFWFTLPLSEALLQT
ncbi:PAS domain S-box protein [Geitlerinema sp. PCC 7407]|uniref:PAS domain-containing sensor histidine kinase n=1 Tax=Geitlerinema sp. PCC 7407 TaxID=1173025 RepID=UPI00167FC18D|nr:PAS domain S-box protein [Geitlerinema sp. PCC 7407]